MSIKPFPLIILLLPLLLFGIAIAEAAETGATSARIAAHPGLTTDRPIPGEHVLAGREIAPARRGAGPHAEHTMPERFNTHPTPDVPRWLKEVRAQRRALQQQRRAAHQARQEALDPVGAAKREERQERRLRRRQEVREFLEHERRLYLNWGPWITPLVPRPPPSAGVDPLSQGSIGSSGTTDGPQADAAPADGPTIPTPSDWDNGWYFNGW